MSLLLDSNVLVWWLMDHDRLSDVVRTRISAERRVMVSLVSPWELWIKRSSGRLDLPARFDEALEDEDLIEVLSPTTNDARLAASLPMLHRDPFDRMIVAQALNRQATLVTSDQVLGAYGVDILLT